MKRRKFIKNSLVGTSVLTLGGSGLISASCQGANDKIVLALIGAGDRGLATIISACKCNENVEIKTICDVKSSRLEIAGKQIEKELGYKPGATKNMKEILEDQDIDAVWIATPDHWHGLATIWACQAGKDVYVEKNPTINILEGRKIIEAAEKYNRIVQVGFQNRSASYGFSARDYIKSGKLGQIVHVKCYNLLEGEKWMPQPDQNETPEWIDWDAWLGPSPYRPFNPAITTVEDRGGWLDFWAFGGGALSGDVSHILDLVRLVLDDPPHPKSVYGCGGNWPWGSEKETPEFVSITYDFEDFTMTCDNGNATNYLKKASNNFRIESDSLPDIKTYPTRVEIYGTKGLMYLAPHGYGWKVVGENFEIIAHDNGKMPDLEHQQNFIESLRSRKKPNGDIEQGHLSACLVHLANIAYRIGNRQIDFDTKKEQFIGNDEVNNLLTTIYRDNYQIPEYI
jgi:predicted dehydrogenase